MIVSDPQESAGSSAPPDAAPDQLPVAELMAQLAQRASSIIAAQNRLRGLLVANRAVVGELTTARVMQRTVEAARSTTGARHAVLGVLDADGRPAEITYAGPDDDVTRYDWRGLLDQLLGSSDHHGAVAYDPGDGSADGVVEDNGSRTIDTGPRRVFGPFLGAPVTVAGAVHGSLVLAEPEHGGGFSVEDEEMLSALAATAGIALENARRYEESRRRQDWLLASSAIAERLLQAGDEAGVWRLIASNVQRLTGAVSVAVVVPVGDSSEKLRIAVAVGRPGDQAEGWESPTEGSIAGQAIADGAGVRADDGAAEWEHWHFRGRSATGPLLAVPLRGEWGSRGAVIVVRAPGERPFSDAERDMAEEFAAQAAVALEEAEARTARHRLAALEDRERIARDLHDHVIQRLFATGLGLQAAAGTTASTAVRERIGRSVQDLDETIRQIRTSIFALRYHRSAHASVRASVLDVAQELAPDLGLLPQTRLTGPLDTLVDEDLIDDVAAVVRAVLTHQAQHRTVSEVLVEVDAVDQRLVLRVRDVGRDRPGAAEIDLDDIAARASRRGGTASLSETDGLVLTWEVPAP